MLSPSSTHFPCFSRLVLFFLPSVNICADMPLDPVGQIQRHLKGKKKYLGSTVCFLKNHAQKFVHKKGNVHSRKTTVSVSYLVSFTHSALCGLKTPIFTDFVFCLNLKQLNYDQAFHTQKDTMLSFSATYCKWKGLLWPWSMRLLAIQSKHMFKDNIKIDCQITYLICLNCSVFP